MSLHVVPINDLIDHLDDGCPCGPDVEYVHPDGTYYAEPLVTHHSLDARELWEASQ